MKISTLKKSKDFALIASSGVKRYSSNFIIYCSDFSNNGETFSVGFTASKRVGNAVARNRAKRRMRALLCDFYSSNSSLLTLNLGITIIAKKTVVTEKWQILKEDFYKTLLSAIQNLNQLHEKNKTQNMLI